MASWEDAGRMLRGRDHPRLRECWRNRPKLMQSIPVCPALSSVFFPQGPWDPPPGSSCSAGAWPLATQVSGGYWGAGEPKVSPGLYAPQEACAGVWGQAVPLSLYGTLPPHPLQKCEVLGSLLTSRLTPLCSPRCHGFAATQHHYPADAGRAPLPR